MFYKHISSHPKHWNWLTGHLFRGCLQMAKIKKKKKKKKKKVESDQTVYSGQGSVFGYALMFKLK